MSPRGFVWLLPIEAMAREGWQLNSAVVQAGLEDTGGDGGLPVPRGRAHSSRGAASLPSPLLRNPAGESSDQDRC